MTRGSLAALVTAVAMSWVLGPAAQADECPNAEIRAQQGVEYLPACMALEMVSPPTKNNNLAQSPQFSSDGTRVLYRSKAALADTPGLVNTINDYYVAHRSGAGWSTEPMSPPAQFAGSDSFIPAMRTSDLARWLWLIPTVRQKELGIAQIFEGQAGGGWMMRSPLLVPLDAALHGEANLTFALWRGASADLSHAVFTPGDDTATYLPGDPQLTGTGRGSNNYVVYTSPAGEPSLALLQRDASGAAIGGSCGAWIGGHAFDGTGNAVATRRSILNQGAISSDGRRMFISTRPAQPAIGACSAASPVRIMRRDETVSGPQISSLIASECARVSPACSATDGDENFQAASVDGARVFFTTTRQLADSDLDTGTACSASKSASQGCDLYMYDAARPVGSRLVQVSAGDASAPTPGSGANVLSPVTSISEDGSHAYFVAKGVLTTDQNPVGATATLGGLNLYVYQRDEEHPSGRTAFIGTLDDVLCVGGITPPSLPPDCEVLFGGAATYRAEVTAVPTRGEDGVAGDGHILVMGSAAPLTPDDTDGLQRDIYRYDSELETLERISRGIPGGDDGGPFGVFKQVRLNSGPDALNSGRWVSEDGNKILFSTDERLTGGSGENGFFYWRSGELTELPGRVPVFDGNNRPNAVLSPDGDTVAYEPDTALLPQDGDTAVDVYVARVDGGFPAPPDPQRCDVSADQCQGRGGASVATQVAVGRGENAGSSARGTLTIARMSARARRRAGRTGSFPLRFRAGALGAISLNLRTSVQGHGLGTIRVVKRLDRWGKATVTVRLGKRARRALSQGRKLVVEIRATTDSARPRSMRVVLQRGDRA